MLSLMSPLLVQYSLLQMSPLGAGAAMVAPWACAAEVRPNTPAPTPSPAALRMVRRASARPLSLDVLWFRPMASSLIYQLGVQLGAHRTIAARAVPRAWPAGAQSTAAPLPLLSFYSAAISSISLKRPFSTTLMKITAATLSPLAFHCVGRA